MIFTDKLILYVKVGLVTKRGVKAVCLPSLYQFLLPELPGTALISESSSILRVVLPYASQIHGVILATRSSCREVQEYPDLLCFAGIQLLQEVPCQFALLQPASSCLWQ